MGKHIALFHLGLSVESSALQNGAVSCSHEKPACC
ncbi:AABR07069878.1 [Phodopus roborovskii]|uniref:AABR07069878.1 protein n=1 Tax=Phodopus roborovskii TaxID=109678 RepID=A0AAU9Z9V9_PHORO|nr:AABR07069878.1 [Phodopus roborovskii]